MATVEQVRRSKRERICDFFSASLGVRFSSDQLHAAFGTAVRSRISELNRDAACPITIHNKLTLEAGREISQYWAEARRPTQPGETFPLFNPGAGQINFDIEASNYPR